jgi:NAD(P)-dependent dehydrogenase (short-subunit alcohol dehydrogenase family)
MTDDELRAAIPALAEGGVAVITGAASGIGLAAAERFHRMGLTLALGDRNVPALVKTMQRLGVALSSQVDVADSAAMLDFAERVGEIGKPIAVLMNNAAVMDNPGSCFAAPDAWRRLLEVNLFGVMNGVQAFAPVMSTQATPSLIINTGSKQGITTPPGNAAYNVSKAGVKAFTEALAHELRNIEGCKASAHLLIPGFTWTGMTSGGGGDKPAGAWDASQVIEFMLESVARGDFYILCPDNDVPRAMDEKRMAWAMGDIIQNRPALSRWHPDYADAFKRYMES